MKKVWQILSYILVAALAAAVTYFVMEGNREYSKLDELRNLIDTCFIGEVDEKALEDAEKLENAIEECDTEAETCATDHVKLAELYAKKEEYEMMLLEAYEIIENYEKENETL